MAMRRDRGDEDRDIREPRIERDEETVEVRNARTQSISLTEELGYPVTWRYDVGRKAFVFEDDTGREISPDVLAALIQEG